MAKRSKNDLEGKRLSSFTLNGILRESAEGKFSVNGEDFRLTQETWVIGRMKVGAIAQVQGVVRSGMGKFASKVTIIRTD